MQERSRESVCSQSLTHRSLEKHLVHEYQVILDFFFSFVHLKMSLIIFLTSKTFFSEAETRKRRHFLCSSSEKFWSCGQNYDHGISAIPKMNPNLHKSSLSSFRHHVILAAFVFRRNVSVFQLLPSSRNDIQHVRLRQRVHSTKRSQ